MSAGLDALLNEAHGESNSVFTNDVIAAAVAKRNEQRKEQYLDSALQFVSQGESNLKAAVANLRRYRKAVRDQEKVVQSIDRAFRYFGETGVVFPLLFIINQQATAIRLCGQLGIEWKDELAKVPEDWQPKA